MDCISIRNSGVRQPASGSVDFPVGLVPLAAAGSVMEALCFAGNDGGNDGATYEQGCGATPHAISEPSRSIKNPYVDVGSCVALQAGYEPMTFESPCKLMTVLVSVINYLNDTSKPRNTRTSCCPKVSKLKRRQGKEIQGPTGFRHGTSLPDGTTLLADYLLLILADFQENVVRCDWWKWGDELFGDKRSFDSSHGLRGYSIDFFNR